MDSLSEKLALPKAPVTRFVLYFGAVIAAYFAVTVTPWFLPNFLTPYLRLNAEVSAMFLNLFGLDATCTDTVIHSPEFSVRIARGCDAVDPSAVFAAAVLAFPVSMRTKIPGVIFGTLLLMLLNLVRIIGLFYTGIYFPRAFDVMHHDVGQALFIFLALLFWMIWAWWAMRGKEAQADALA